MGTYGYLGSYLLDTAALFLFPHTALPRAQPWRVFLVPAICCVVVFNNWARMLASYRAP